MNNWVPNSTTIQSCNIDVTSFINLFFRTRWHAVPVMLGLYVLSHCVVFNICLFVCFYQQQVASSETTPTKPVEDQESKGKYWFHRKAFALVTNLITVYIFWQLLVTVALCYYLKSRTADTHLPVILSQNLYVFFFNFKLYFRSSHYHNSNDRYY